MASWSYAVLADVSICYPPVWDRLFTRYSPVRRWNIQCASTPDIPARLACVKHAASVRPEPGSNSYVQFLFIPAGSSFNSPAFHSSFARVSPLASPRSAWLYPGLPRLRRGYSPTSPRFYPRLRRVSLPARCLYFLRFALYSFQGALCAFLGTRVILSKKNSHYKLYYQRLLAITFNYSVLFQYINYLIIISPFIALFIIIVSFLKN